MGKLLVKHCDLGDHYVEAGTPGDYVDIDQGDNIVEQAWACIECIRRVEYKARTLNEDRPPEKLIELIERH